MNGYKGWCNFREFFKGEVRLLEFYEVRNLLCSGTLASSVDKRSVP
jgi:hypothetical protein